MADTNKEKQFEQLPTRYGSIDVPPRPPENQPIYEPPVHETPDISEYDLPYIQSQIQEELEVRFGSEVKLERPPDHIDSDYAVRLFKPLAEAGPEVVDQKINELVASLSDESVVKGLSLEGPYLNIKLNPEVVGTSVIRTIEAMGEKYGSFNAGDGATVIFDTSSPNIAKQMTVAHLRSTVIGETLGRLYQNCGYRVIRDNHLGDWGSQFGILGHAYELWGDQVPELREGGDPIKGLLELYVRINSEIEDEEAVSETGSELRQKGLEWFRKLEHGDPKARELWRWALDISMVEANRIYNRLGSNFEYILGESEYVQMLPQVIEALKKAGLANKDDLGRVVVDFDENSKIKPLLIQKSDGSSLYATRDLATLAARSVWFKPEKVIYVVGGEQKHYFQQVFETFNRYSDAVGETPPETEHVYFGMVKLPTGRMSTRKGNIIFLEDVINEAVTRARKIVQEHAGESNIEFSEAEIDKIAEDVGVGAVVYSELRQGRTRGIEFKWDEVLSFRGNSGPYLQYTNARINAIFRRLGEYEIDFDSPLKITDEIEAGLALKLGEFPEAIKSALDKNEPSVVAEYLHDLCSAYNGFYRDNPVLAAQDKQIKDSRLRLCNATSIVLKRGMHLLGVPLPERM